MTTRLASGTTVSTSLPGRSAPNFSMRRVTRKRQYQLAQEKALTQQLLIRSNGQCEKCHEWPDWRGLSKHEIRHRSQGGDPLDPGNCLLLCGKCHSGAHGIRET